MPEKTIQSIIKIIPNKYLIPALGKSLFVLFKLMLFGVLAYGFLVFSWIHSLYFFFPVAWFFAGTFINSMFVIAHDCGHMAFFRSKKANFLVGQLLSLPSLYPFYAWIISHNAHHKLTAINTVEDKFVYCDSGWRHYSDELYDQLKKRSKITALFCRVSRYFIVIVPSSLGHVIHYHYQLKWYKKEDKLKVFTAQLISFVFLVGTGILIVQSTDSWYALFYFFIIPIYICHQQISLTTYLAHISQSSREYSPEEWTPYIGRVKGTYNVYLPRWLSYLLFNIDIHVPHHISTSIPCYFLSATQEVLSNSHFAEDIQEEIFTLKGYLDLIKLRKGCGIMLT